MVMPASPPQRAARPSDDVKIQAEFDGLNVLSDVHWTDVAGGRVDQGNAAAAEAVIVVFKAQRPFLRESPLDAETCGPADTILRSLEIERRAEKCSAGGVFVACPGSAAFCV